MQPGGAVKATNPLPAVSEAEKKLLAVAIAGLKGNIAKGVEFAQASSAKL
jgi:malate dehydrogenase